MSAAAERTNGAWDQRPDDVLLDEINDRKTEADDFWREPFEQRDKDMQAVAGDPWDEADRRARENAGRPCVAFDELNQYFNGVINDIRANPKSVKFTANGYGANDDTAEFYADKMREIEYRSKATIAYTRAAEDAIQGSLGYVRINTVVVNPETGEQDVQIRPIFNPDQVLPDPLAQMPDLSDAEYVFVAERWRQKEFLRRFPNAKVRSFDAATIAEAPKWFSGDSLVLAEYWYQHEGRICQALTNGVEVLERNNWAGAYLPFASCYGKTLYVKQGGMSKRVFLSMTRLARDPYMAYCWAQSSILENIGQTTKNPYWAYDGQLTPKQMEALASSLHAPVAVLLAQPYLEGMPHGGQPLPLPQRSMNAPEIQALSYHAETLRRAIQAAFGQTPLPTSAQRQNEKSGKALQQIEQSGQRGAFHFIDNYALMIERVGVICEDLIGKVIDTPRDVTVRKPGDKAEVVRVNDQNAEKFIPTATRHEVTVSTGPSFDSEREAASDFADTLVSLGPQVFTALGPLVVRLKNLGPIGDEIAKKLEKMQPPELRDAPSDGQTPDAGQLQAQLMQMQAQMQQMGAALQQAQQELQTEAAKQAATVEKARIDADIKRYQIDKDAETKILAAHIDAEAKKEAARIAAQAKIEAADEAGDVRMMELAHESAENSKDREQADRNAGARMAMAGPEMGQEAED